MSLEGVKGSSEIDAPADPLAEQAAAPPAMDDAGAGVSADQRSFAAAALANDPGATALRSNLTGDFDAPPATDVPPEVDDPYDDPRHIEDVVPDNTPIFKHDPDGKVALDANGKPELDRKEILTNLTQIQKEGRSAFDQVRCGPTAVIGGAIAAGGKEGLLKLVRAMEQKFPAMKDDYQKIEAKIEDGSATHADLGKLDTLIYFDYHGLYPNEPLEGFSTRMELDLCRAAGLSGKPVLYDADRSGHGDHWLMTGKDDQGRSFVYDPYPKGSYEPQTVYQGSDAFKRYWSNIQSQELRGEKDVGVKGT